MKEGEEFGNRSPGLSFPGLQLSHGGGLWGGEIRGECWKAYLGQEVCSPVLWVPCPAGEHAVLQAPLGKASHPCTVLASICDSGHTVSFPGFFLLPGSSSHTLRLLASAPTPFHRTRPSLLSQPWPTFPGLPAPHSHPLIATRPLRRGLC